MLVQMTRGWILVVLIGQFLTFNGTIARSDLSESDLHRFNEEYVHMSWIHQSLEWQYSTNITEKNGEALRDFQEVYSGWMKGWKMRARMTDISRMNASYQRMINLLSAGVVFSNPRASREVTEIRTRLAQIYAKGSVSIPEAGISATGEDEVETVMRSNRDPDILIEIWKQWQQSVGPPIRSPFVHMVTLLNKSYKNYGEVWKEELEIEDVESEALRLWSQIKEFYRLLLSHVRCRLQIAYGASYLNDSGLISVPLLGSLWGYNWKGVEPLVLPFPNSPLSSSTDFEQNPEDLVQFVEDFYASMGLPRMTATFWNKSIFQRPSDSSIVDCHGSAVDFQKDDDFRMKVCLSAENGDNRNAVFHEMGHVTYFMAYRHQPAIFRNSPNSAFHESVGDTVANGAEPCFSPGNTPTTYEQELNFLMRQALTKAAILPWALIVDIWRYRVFEGVVPEAKMNSYWWTLRERFQGVKSAEESAFEDFDPGTKYHIANFVPYMRYFFSHILQFQLLESLCATSGEVELSRCCLRGNKQAGKKLWQMMSLGASKPWPEVLHSITGSRQMSATPFLRYFQPLHKWLIKSNKGLRNY